MTLVELFGHDEFAKWAASAPTGALTAFERIAGVVQRRQEPHVDATVTKTHFQKLG